MSRLLLVLVLAASAWLVAPAAGAQTGGDEPPPSFENTIPAQSPRIVVEPNSGQVPTYEGQRGTTSQFAVLGAILVGLASIIVFVRRESRRKRAGRPAQTASSTRSDPVADTSENRPDSSARQ